jgi:hypothetical protein
VSRENIPEPYRAFMSLLFDIYLLIDRSTLEQ